MQISIKTQTGRTIKFNFELKDTWLDIKNKVFLQEGISIDSQRLIVCGKRKDDNETVYDTYTRDEQAFLVVSPKPAITISTHTPYKILAFDLSETLQTGSENNDGGLGQPMTDEYDEIIDGAYSVMVGGIDTAKLLQKAQEMKIPIVLVTNNGDDLDTNIIARTLAFLKNYGVIIAPENYLGPKKGSNGSKVLRLQEILLRFNISKDDLVFFDDSKNNVEEAQAEGFNAIRVKSPKDLQEGISNIINELTGNLKLNLAPNNPSIPNKIKSEASSASTLVNFSVFKPDDSLNLSNQLSTVQTSYQDPALLRK